MKKEHLQNNHISVYLYVLKLTLLHGIYMRILGAHIFLNIEHKMLVYFINLVILINDI